MLPALQSLVALQALDSAADAARRRLAELPAAEQEIQRAIAAATTTAEAVKAQQQENQQARRALEKDVAQVDTRLKRFDDHKAAIKTNQEYTALLHEIATAKTEKDAIEDRILGLMEDADRLAAELKAAQQAQASAKADGDKARAALDTERAQLDRELARLSHERTAETRGIDAVLQAKYDQLIKQRRGIAVAQMIGETCAACHVRLRPHVAQQIRRNDSIVQCDSCQRILHFQPPPV
jgi:predicted  nucleic acid-binding Zn-ribbon protein